MRTQETNIPMTDIFPMQDWNGSYLLDHDGSVLTIKENTQVVSVDRTVE